MNWEAFFETLLIFALLAAAGVACYLGITFVCWSCSAVERHFGPGWSIALFLAYIAFGIALMVGLGTDE